MKNVKQKFRVRLIGRGTDLAWGFLTVPFSVEKVFGSKARVPVAGTLNGTPFRNSLMPCGDGTHSMHVNKPLLAQAKAKIGDMVEVVMSVDKKERTVETPRDVKKAIMASEGISPIYGKLSYSHKKELMDWINDAKKPETRARRIEKMLAMLVKKFRE